MDQDELFEDLYRFLEEDDPGRWRAANLSEQELKDLAAGLANRHFGGHWTEEEQELVDIASEQYQQAFIVSARHAHQWSDEDHD